MALQATKLQSKPEGEMSLDGSFLEAPRRECSHIPTVRCPALFREENQRATVLVLRGPIGERSLQRELWRLRNTGGSF